MSTEAARGKSAGSPRVDEREHAPNRLTDLPKQGWWSAIKRAVAEFRTDNLPDWAAALTYYSVLSIFPALLVLVSIIGLIGPSATNKLIENIQEIAVPES